VCCVKELAVKVNDLVGPYFQSYKGVRQGDPLPPLLFNFVADCLTRMVLRAQQNSLISGLIKNLIPRGVATLQYADDTIICLEHDMEQARNMKLLLYMFEQMSGLKINFDKSEVLLVGGDNNLVVAYAEVFNCKIELFPIRYLGVPISAGRLRVIDWIKLDEKSAKKLDVWQGGVMSFGGRTILINASLSNASIYHMSMFLLPKTTIENLDKRRRRFFWQEGSLKRKCQLVRWEFFCRDGKKGGLGIKNLRKMNISLLCK
jgi:hypothetical protein